jgi:CBS domain-containing protein
MTRPQVPISSDAPLPTVEEALAGDRPGVPVIDGVTRDFAGVVTPATLRRATPEERVSATVRRVLAFDAVTLSPNQTLDQALERMAEGRTSWAPVLEDRRLVGELQVSDAIRTYKSMLHRDVRRASGLSPSISTFEVRVKESSPLAGKTLADARFPAGSLVVAITRDGETLFPMASTRVMLGDVVTVMSDANGEDDLRAFLEGSSVS